MKKLGWPEGTYNFFIRKHYLLVSIYIYINRNFLFRKSRQFGTNSSKLSEQKVPTVFKHLKMELFVPKLIHLLYFWNFLFQKFKTIFTQFSQISMFNKIRHSIINSFSYRSSTCTIINTKPISICNRINSPSISIFIAG